MAYNVYWEDVEIGEAIPEWSRKTDLMNWNRFAAVNDEFVYIHMDDEAGREAGYDAAFGMGNLRFAYLHNMLRDWISDRGQIIEVSCQYRLPNMKNDHLVCRGRITKKYVEEGKNLLELELRVDNQQGQNTSPGKAIVSLPSRTN